MEKYDNTLIVITGASTGLGRHATQTMLSEIYQQHQINAYKTIPLVIGLSRREIKYESVATPNQPNLDNFVSLQADLAQPEQIKNVFDKIGTQFDGRKISVVLLNAGMCKAVPLIDHPNLQEHSEPDTSFENAAAAFSQMANLNLVGLALCLRKAVQYMDLNFPGYIINLCSMAGHRMPGPEWLHFYSATKYAITGLTHATRKELRKMNSEIRVGQLCPGFVDTELFQAMDTGNQDFMDSMNGLVKDDKRVLACTDVSECFMMMVKSHPRCQIGDIMLKATKEDGT